MDLLLGKTNSPAFRMGRKLCLTSFIDRMAARSGSSPSWRWSSCKHPRTRSFRKEELNGATTYDDDDIDSHSSYLDPSQPGTWVDNSAEAVSFHGLRSDDRLSFEPAGCTRSLVAEETVLDEGSSTVPPFQGSVAMVMDSADPYLDFKASMAETMMVHGVRDWEWLQEMLLWYLRVNEKRNHGVIVGAFMDLLVRLASSASSSSSAQYSSSSSSSFSCENEYEDGA